MTEKIRKKPTPRNADSILQGALKLSLSEQVNLLKEVRKSIDEKIQKTQKDAEEAKQIVNGL